MANKRRKKASMRKSHQSARDISPGVIEQRTKKAMKNFWASFIFFAISLVFYNYSTIIFWENTFFLLTAVFGFLALAFLIAWLVLVIVKKRKN